MLRDGPSVLLSVRGLVSSLTLRRRVSAVSEGATHAQATDTIKAKGPEPKFRAFRFIGAFRRVYSRATPKMLSSQMNMVTKLP